MSNLIYIFILVVIIYLSQIMICEVSDSKLLTFLPPIVSFLISLIAFYVLFSSGFSWITYVLIPLIINITTVLCISIIFKNKNSKDDDFDGIL